MTLPAMANGTVAAIAVPPVAKPTPMPRIAPLAPPTAAAAKGVARLATAEGGAPHIKRYLLALAKASPPLRPPNARFSRGLPREPVGRPRMPVGLQA